MNTIEILEPRWHDSTLLIADWKIAAENKIIVRHHSIQDVFYATGDYLKSFPLEIKTNNKGKEFEVRAVPLNKLDTEPIINL